MAPTEKTAEKTAATVAKRILYSLDRYERVKTESCEVRRSKDELERKAGCSNSGVSCWDLQWIRTGLYTTPRGRMACLASLI